MYIRFPMSPAVVTVVSVVAAFCSTVQAAGEQHPGGWTAFDHFLASVGDESASRLAQAEGGRASLFDVFAAHRAAEKRRFAIAVGASADTSAVSETEVAASAPVSADDARVGSAPSPSGQPKATKTAPPGRPRLAALQGKAVDGNHGGVHHKRMSFDGNDVSVILFGFLVMFLVYVFLGVLTVMANGNTGADGKSFAGMLQDKVGGPPSISRMIEGMRRPRLVARSWAQGPPVLSPHGVLVQPQRDVLGGVAQESHVFLSASVAEEVQAPSWSVPILSMNGAPLFVASLQRGVGAQRNEIQITSATGRGAGNGMPSSMPGMAGAPLASIDANLDIRDSFGVCVGRLVGTGNVGEYGLMESGRSADGGAEPSVIFKPSGKGGLLGEVWFRPMNTKISTVVQEETDLGDWLRLTTTSAVDVLLVVAPLLGLAAFRQAGGASPRRSVATACC